VLVLSFSWLTDLAKLVCCLSISANFCLVFSTSIGLVYNNEGTLIKYNGRNLGEDLDNDTNSQDTSDQQEASDKQKPIDVEKTKQKISRAAKESNVVSITDIDLNVKSRGSKLFLICVVCVACVAYVVCVGLKFLAGFITMKAP
jgi:hypothetical protein